MVIRTEQNELKVDQKWTHVGPEIDLKLTRKETKMDKIRPKIDSKVDYILAKI